MSNRLIYSVRSSHTVCCRRRWLSRLHTVATALLPRLLDSVPTDPEAIYLGICTAMRLEDEVKITKLVLSESKKKNCCASIWAMLDALGYSVSRGTHRTRSVPLQQAFAALERSATFGGVEYGWVKGGRLPIILKASASLLHHRACKHVCSGATKQNNRLFMQAFNYAAKDRQGRPRSVLG